MMLRLFTVSLIKTEMLNQDNLTKRYKFRLKISIL
jgi:hypothetical protein